MTGSSDAAVEAEFLQLLNGERASAGCPALRRNTLLAGVAELHSRDMAEQDYLSNHAPDGRSGKQRMYDAGYRYVLAKEMVAASQTTAAQVLAAWLQSTEYRTRMLSCQYTEAGVGMWRDPDSRFGYYWTLDMGTPA
ncbi:MAG: CAP domain-containing protein [Angustibacter sp.]